MSIIIGLTGQSGAGKTTVSQTLSSQGLGIINCDEIARKCTADASECNAELAKFFPECFDDKLVLDRKAISEIIFTDRNMLYLFDSIVYPFILKEINNEIKALSDSFKYIVLDAPTLFESGADKLCDIKIAVISDSEKRLKRIMNRDRISRELAIKRFNSQLSADYFKKNCEYIIENNSTLEKAEQKTKEVIKEIKKKYGN